MVVEKAIDARKSDDEGGDDDDDGVSCAMKEDSAEVGAADDDGMEMDDGIDEDIEDAEDDAIKLDEVIVVIVDVVIAMALNAIEAAFVLRK